MSRRAPPSLVVVGLVFSIAAILLPAAAAPAATYYAVSSGTWETPSIWNGPSGPGLPGSSDTAYIGYYHSFYGGASTASVTLTQNETASSVYLGFGSGNSGTLDLGSNSLQVGGSLYIGNASGGTGAINRSASGSLSLNNMYLDGGNSLTLGSTDSVSGHADLHNNSWLTTVSTGNVTGYPFVRSGSTLTMGADMNCGWIEVEDAGSTLDMGRHHLTASTQITLGWSAGPVVVANRGPLTASGLLLGNQEFNLIASDSVTNFTLKNATSTPDPANSVSSLYLQSGSQFTVVSSGNVTKSVTVATGSRLNMNADMNLSGQFTLRDNGSTLDMGGHTLATLPAGSISLGSVGATVNLLNRGPLKTATLNIYDMPFNLSSSDSATTLNVYNNAHVTTAATGNVTDYVYVNSGGTLTLGADMTLAHHLQVNGLNSTSTLDMGGHTINASASASQVSLGGSSGPVNLINPGQLLAYDLYIGNGSAITLSSGSDKVGSSLRVQSNAKLTLLQSDGQLTGLTLDGRSASSLFLDTTDALVLDFARYNQESWLFRWADPSGGGNWISTLDGLIDAKKIVVNAPNGYQILDQSGYTTIVANPVPEPATLALLACGIVATLSISASNANAARHRRFKTSPPTGE